MASVRFVSTFNKNQYKIKVLRNEFNDYCSYSIIVALVTLVAFDFYEWWLDEQFLKCSSVSKAR